MKGRWLKYLLLIAILAAAIGGQNLVWTADPLAWSTRIVTYGLWPPVAALANAILDLIRPMMEHWGLFELARFELHQPSFSAAGVIALSFLAGLLALGLLQRRLWCRCLCPLGALLAIFSRFSPLRRLVDERCDHDGRCHRRCETGAIPAAGERSYSPSECIMCQRCVPDCHLCITRFGLARPKETQTVDIDLNRRQLLAGIGASIGLTGALVLSSRTVPASPANSPIRPPSSIPERAFGATCIRCGQCIKTCPTGCLQPSLAAGGLAGLMTPVAVMRIGACDPNCTACTAVCPTEAIRPLAASEKRYARLGTARVDHDRCIAWSQGRHCLVCDEFCPYGAIEWSEGSSGIRRPHVVTERCNGCGNCEKVCPVEGAAAIRVSAAGQVRIARGSIRAAAHQAGYRPVDWKDFGP